VEVYTKNDDDKYYKWTSDLNSESKTYTIDELNYENVKRGTKLVIHIKDDCLEYLDSLVLKNIIKTYSNFNEYLIELYEQEEKRFLPANNQTPIWLRSPNELCDEDYLEFYKNFELNSPPLTWKHFKVEGDISYNCILYIPSELPHGAIENLSNIHNMKLYVKRVFIMDNNKDLLPEWARFLFGIIDTDDLQLNVSREILQ
jgi:molecular chaperone HtpG